MDNPIGTRVRSLITDSGKTQRDVARDIEMAPDALSRALSGQRGFGALELARIADLFEVDLHWLVTGERDPNAWTLAARHSYDPASGQYANDSRDGDDDVLRDVRLAYTQAYPDGVPSSRGLSHDPRVLRGELGAEFVPQFAERLEAALDVDVVRVPGIETDYSLTIGGRNVIVLAATPNWFRENWSLAHELGHLALGHHCTPETSDVPNEAAANKFAARLIVPDDTVGSVSWSDVGDSELGELLWAWGVSTTTVANRLKTLRLQPSAAVEVALSMSTQSFLRQRAFEAARWGEIVERERQAVGRRFPTHLLLAHEAAIAEGRLHARTRAWMLGVEEAVLDDDGPPITVMSDDELAKALGFEPA